MKTAIILHGMPSRENYHDPGGIAQSNSHWLGWLQQQLLANDILAQAPEMPRPYEPVYEDWKQEFERFDSNEDTMLIGHSCGAGFIVRYLSEHKQASVGRVVLVAPWLDLEKTLKTGMFEFNIDPTVAERAEQISIFNSSDDDDYIQASVKAIRDKIPSTNYKEFSGYGHFTFGTMKSNEFPELIDILLD